MYGYKTMVINYHYTENFAFSDEIYHKFELSTMMTFATNSNFKIIFIH